MYFLPACLVVLASMATTGLRMIILLLFERRHESRTAAYVHLGFTRFLYCYARGHYADAGVWCRRIAEAFCINALREEYADEKLPLLARMVYELPYSISWSRAFDLCDDFKETAAYLGCHMSALTVWDDLHKMRVYGNSGAHAHSYFLESPNADPDVFLATLRIAVATSELHRGRKSRL